MQDHPNYHRLLDLLQRAFPGSLIDLRDVSLAHKDHVEGGSAGGTHFDLLLISSHFAGKSRVERHRFVNSVLSSELGVHVHALSIKALTPEEHTQQRNKGDSDG